MAVAVGRKTVKTVGNARENDPRTGIIDPSQTASIPGLNTPSGKPRRGRIPMREKMPEGDAYAPGMPTNGADLMALWGLPSAAWNGGRVKITRRKYMSAMEQELIGETDIENYSMANLARELGPGDYYLLLSAHPQQLWGTKKTKLGIAPQYAAEAGWQQYPVAQAAPPMPRISEARALQGAAQALDGTRPVSVADLASLIEMVVDRTAQAMQRNTPAPAPNPLGIDGMMTLWSAMNNMQVQAEERTMKLAAMFQGKKIKDPDDEEETKESWMGDLLKAVPTILQVFAPKPQPQPIPQPAMQGNPPAAQPQPAPGEEEKMTNDIPLSSEEKEQFKAPVYMLQMFVPIILQALTGPATAAVIAADLEGFIPFKMEQPLIDLAKIVKERGPLVLAFIDQRLATEKGAELIAELAKILEAEGKEGSE